MEFEQYLIARLIHERTIGLVKEIHAYYSVIEFRRAGHKWTVIVDNDDYEIIDEITFSIEEF